MREREPARNLCQVLNSTRESDRAVRRGVVVQICTALHPMDAPLRRPQEYGKPVEIGSDVWVGGGAIICPGVRVVSRAVIGAGSVVTRNVPDDVFAAGNPCRVIRPIARSDRPATR